MPRRSYLGEFEQMVLLAILKHDNDAYGVRISRELEESTERSVSRSALYTTLDRLGRKALVEWEMKPGGDARGGLPKRCFRVTSAGIEALKATRTALLNLWKGTEHVLGEIPS